VFTKAKVAAKTRLRSMGGVVQGQCILVASSDAIYGADQVRPTIIVVIVVVVVVVIIIITIIITISITITAYFIICIIFITIYTAGTRPVTVLCM
jgi:hypothetical protein